MAKINHNNSLDTIDELLTDATQRGIIHLVTDIDKMSDRNLRISDKDLLNFGTCGYLGLELDQRLKDGAIEFVQKYGTQFSVSRSYLSSGINMLLENYLSKMYDNSQVIVYSSTSTAHISIIPTLVKHDDAVILDQQVHMSVQTATQLLRQKGVPIEMIRHSNMEMLERLLEQMFRKHKNIWYMIDGVYSMFGDLAPMDDLMILLDKYEGLHLYIDDAHGVGWYGKNGTGYAFSKAKKHPRVIIVNTLAKGFGVMGGVAVFPTEELCHKVRIFGGPLTYSHPLSPPLIGSSIASAKIHLSDEITLLQQELRESMDYCNQLLANTDLTVISNPITPIYFIGMGQPKVGYNMVSRLLKDGFFVNPALFPAVSIKNTGLRFTITRHVKKEDIKSLVEAMVYHYPKVLNEEEKTISDIQKAFKVDEKSISKSIKNASANKEEFIVEIFKTIKDIKKEEWDSLLGKNGSFDWSGMLSLEDIFQNNERPEENWDFYYIIIRDQDKQPILATFLTSTIYKDDMLALESISLQIEEKRKTNPYYLTSRTLTMGSMFTEGHHYYINKANPKWKQSFKLLLEKATEIQDSINANSLLMRDFDKDDLEFKDLLMKEGFITVNMPNSNIVNDITWNSREELLQKASARNKHHIKYEVFKHEHNFDIEFKKQITEEDEKHYYKLYQNVADRNRSFNMFSYPEKLLKKLSDHPNWEFIELKLKPEYDTRADRKAVAVAFCYVTDHHLAFMIVGMDYDYAYKYKVYKQMMYQVLKRTRALGLSKAFLGLSADFEKRKYGAIQQTRVAYLQTKDNYNMEVIESMAAAR